MNDFESKVYKLWQNIKSRCYNNKHNSYKYYGAKDVKMCDEWKTSFEKFLNDVPLIPNFDYDNYMDGKLFLDKDLKSDKDNKIYSLETCTFLTRVENNRLANPGKYFYVVYPNGKIEEGIGIKTFCKNYRLPCSHAMKMYNGDNTRKTVKGFQFFDHYPNENEILKPRTYQAISPKGKIIIFYRYDSLEYLGHSAPKVRSAIKSNKTTKDGWKFSLIQDGYRLTKKQEEKYYDSSN